MTIASWAIIGVGAFFIGLYFFAVWWNDRVDKKQKS